MAKYVYETSIANSVDVLLWPRSLPDLSPIENMLYDVKRQGGAGQEILNIS